MDRLRLTRLTVAVPLTLLTAALTACQSVLAQSVAPPAPKQELHRAFLAVAIDNFDKAMCGQGQSCAPATAAERANPPLSDEQARSIVSAGVISVTADHCGLDWQRWNFVPLMRHHRETLKLNEREMALVGLLHGITMGQVGEIARKSPCTPELKAATEQRLIAR
jgi:hypothetical protein